MEVINFIIGLFQFLAIIAFFIMTEHVKKIKKSQEENAKIFRALYNLLDEDIRLRKDELKKK